MIKKLPINRTNKSHIEGFIRHLQALGYSEPRRMGIGVHEFCWRMEQQGKDLEQITATDIEAHYAYLLERPNQNTGGALSLQTVSGYLYALRLFFSYAQQTELIAENPMSALRFPPHQTGQRQALSKSQIAKLYAVCQNEQERALLALFYGCGLRRSEAVKLNLKDVDLRGLWLYVRSGKGRKRRVVPLAEGVAQDLKAYRHGMRPTQETRWTDTEDKKAFMLNKRGQRMRGGSYWDYFKVILKRSGLKEQVSVHHLRHSVATHLLAEGMSVEAVRDFLGHEFLESTQIYTRITSEQLRL